MVDVDFYYNLVCFTAIWCILRPFGIFCGHLVPIISCFAMLYQEKSGNPVQTMALSLAPTAHMVLGARCYEFVFATCPVKAKVQPTARGR
jgi:hypothetical protein